MELVVSPVPNDGFLFISHFSFDSLECFCFFGITNHAIQYLYSNARDWLSKYTENMTRGRSANVTWTAVVLFSFHHSEQWSNGSQQRWDARAHKVDCNEREKEREREKRGGDKEDCRMCWHLIEFSPISLRITSLSFQSELRTGTDDLWALVTQWLIRFYLWVADLGWIHPSGIMGLPDPIFRQCNRIIWRKRKQ